MQVIPYVGYSLYQMFLIFCFWSFVGWCIEVVDMTFETGEYQNRGFLNMPICPIYGVGVLMIIIFFRGLRDNIPLLVLSTTVLCTAFEFFMGWGMEKLFHAKWWDYSHMKFNFMGYICLRNSLFFGIGSVVVMIYVQPTLEKMIDSIPVKAGLCVVFVMVLLIVLDLAASLLAVKKLNDKIRRLDEISKILLSVSVKTGMKLATGTLKVKANIYKIKDVKDNVVEKVQDVKGNVAEKVHDVKENVAERVERVQDLNANNMEKLKSEYERLIMEKDAVTERIIKAFPKLRSNKYSDSLQLIKDRIYGKISRISFMADDESEDLSENIDDSADRLNENNKEKEENAETTAV